MLLPELSELSRVRPWSGCGLASADLAGMRAELGGEDIARRRVTEFAHQLAGAFREAGVFVARSGKYIVLLHSGPGVDEFASLVDGVRLTNPKTASIFRLVVVNDDWNSLGDESVDMLEWRLYLASMRARALSGTGHGEVALSDVRTLVAFERGLDALAQDAYAVPPIASSDLGLPRVDSVREGILLAKSLSFPLVALADIHSIERGYGRFDLDPEHEIESSRMFGGLVLDLHDPIREFLAGRLTISRYLARILNIRLAHSRLLASFGRGVSTSLRRAGGVAVAVGGDTYLLCGAREAEIRDALRAGRDASGLRLRGGAGAMVIRPDSDLDAVVDGLEAALSQAKRNKGLPGADDEFIQAELQ